MLAAQKVVPEVTIRSEEGSELTLLATSCTAFKEIRSLYGW